MANIVLIANGKNEKIAKDAESLKKWLAQGGHDVRTHILSDLSAEGSASKPSAGREKSSIAEPEKLDLAISFGGDGATLHTVEAVSDAGVPVLGVNYGQLGYLAEVDPADTRQAIESFLRGEYSIEERMRLSAEKDTPSKRDTSKEHVANALNEVFLGKVESGHTIRLALHIDKGQTSQEPFMIYEADGLIISTPTGSTAYSLSAGGPILESELEAMVITPVAPHMIFDRSLVISPNSELRLEVLGHYPAEFSMDGYGFGEIKPSESVVIRRATQPARLVTYKKRDFHKVLKSKFGLKDR